jgi:hypothetical protein
MNALRVAVGGGGLCLARPRTRLALAATGCCSGCIAYGCPVLLSGPFTGQPGPSPAGPAD